jgi:hypothetical protein
VSGPAESTLYSSLVQMISINLIMCLQKLLESYLAQDSAFVGSFEHDSEVSGPGNAGDFVSSRSVISIFEICIKPK